MSTPCKAKLIIEDILRAYERTVVFGLKNNKKRALFNEAVGNEDIGAKKNFTL